MQRGTVGLVAVLGALSLVLTTAGAASAATTWASGAYTIADVEEENLIEAGWPSMSDARDCLYPNACPELENVAYKNVDISGAMQDYEDYAYFIVRNGLTSRTTLWIVCSYDGGGAILDCWFDDERSWGLMGYLSSEARELRLVPVHSAPNEYHLSVYVD